MRLPFQRDIGCSPSYLNGRKNPACERSSSGYARPRSPSTESWSGRAAAGSSCCSGSPTDDADESASRLARKVARLRIFENEDGRFDRSLVDERGDALVVSQFTLIADTHKGNRPSFSAAAPPAEAEPLYERFCSVLEGEGVPVDRGVFGARMEVTLVNDGPVTIVVES